MRLTQLTLDREQVHSIETVNVNLEMIYCIVKNGLVDVHDFMKQVEAFVIRFLL